jgi:predicted peroxiredoxin
VRGPVAGAVDQAEYLAGVGQGDDQRVIAPGAVVANVHALLAGTGGGDQAAIHVNLGTLEESVGLLGPNLEPRIVDDIEQGVNVVACEASAEVACGSRVGDASCAQGLEEVLVVAAEFDVLEAGAVAEGVVGDVEDVIGLVVG